VIPTENIPAETYRSGGEMICRIRLKPLNLAQLTGKSGLLPIFQPTAHSCDLDFPQ
jgi:hypothetical protein